MGTMMGNFFALIVVVASALVGSVSLEASAITFVAIAYALWLIILLSNFFTKPSKDAPFCQLLYPKEIEAYRTYHLHFGFSGAAQAYSALLNGLRLAGFVWGGLCLWKGLYWMGSASIAYFFVTGGLILKLNPWLYMGTAAQKGNQVASEQLSLIERVQAKREAYNAEPEA
ncbi:MAG: hypothetical protein PHY54_19160 [Methylococcales bacterium]|jgi:hypothetical protein|nr:hypothetical protein [Methylococcales bacterium]